MSVRDETRLIEMFYDCFCEVPDENNLYFFLRFFPKKYYCALRAEYRENIESCVLKGIANGKLNYITGKTSGTYSVAATWAADFIEQFDTKEQIIDAIRQHAIKFSLSQNYAIWFFNDYVNLDNQVNLSYYKNTFRNKKKLRAIDYEFLRIFISDKRNKLYAEFGDLIDLYERTKNLAQEKRIPDELSDGCPF